ncbi:SSI family serine proteinase inhibitor [Streptomyces sp. SPB074]|uniref:SSI family serine proteinase inhibitor n=1 Tax=Streptomyces sp. (strain SPB074) TaxID=465543 RepID=UPI00017F14A9|nr:SSI family serine proteinase inhibitor [Streptomyces sp. SPB074]EDY46810.1 secreted protein [Streptomyces sp. SPB074]
MSVFRPRAFRTALLLAGCLLGLGAGTAPATAVSVPEPPGGDRLLVKVTEEGGSVTRYELRCHPTGGDHPEAAAACARLDEVTVWGRDTFAPVAPDAICTMQYGGARTAHVSGEWAGRPVDATFSRTNGCEIARWDRLVPLLPAQAGAGPDLAA